jgi:hypothetical protein
MLTAVTYIRAADRTRIVYVLPMERGEALAQAAELAPRDFALAAVCHPADDEQMLVPQDGDNYGDEVTAPWLTPASASAGR